MYLEGGCTDIAAVTEFRNNRFRAESGVESAISELACDYYFGRGTDLNQIEALVWLRKGVEIDDTYCNYLLGHMMRFGIGLALDKKSALLHLTKAAKQGHVGASRMAVELLLEDGSDLKKIKQAIKLLTNLGNGGDSNSQFELGYIYSNGERVPLDQEKAIYWYSKAADQGHTAALFNLGIKHEFGTGVEKNQHLALALYRRSAEGGLVRACEELGQIFSAGKFGEKNQKEADKWIAEADRLKTEAEKMKSKQIVPNLTLGSASVRRQRLEHKRSLERKASQILSGS
jgi:TPR repeat protein